MASKKIRGKQVDPTFVDPLSAPVKYFVIPHPDRYNEGKVLVHSCLEGNENSVYFKGKNFYDTIVIPSYWYNLVHQDSITVHLTPFGCWQDLYVKKIESDRIFVGSKGDSKNMSYFYMVTGIRKDIPLLEVVQDAPSDED